MDRIFTSLSVVALILLGANLYVGWTGGDVNAAATELRTQKLALNEVESSLTRTKKELAEQREIMAGAQSAMDELNQSKGRHVILGLLSAVVTLIVNSICVTYFIGTGRWCTEVSMTYELDPSHDQAARRLKRKTFPWSMLAIGTVLTISALGAAADPATLRETTAKWVAPHFLFAIIGMFVIAYSLWRQYQGIQQNGRVIDGIMEEVRRVRAEKGLDVESPVTGADDDGATDSGVTA